MATWVELSVLIRYVALGGAFGWDRHQTIQPFFMLHIGEIIKREMERQERSPSWLAHKINCQRSNIYYIFKQKSINTELLISISKALKHNFFSYYTDSSIFKDI